MNQVESLPLMLKQLGLSCMLNKWESLQQKALDEQWTHGHYLAKLAELEANFRYQKRIARHIKESKLPPGKSLAQFDFKLATTVNQQQIVALAENVSWVKQASNCIIFGPSGVGKTHIACAIGYRLIELGVRCFFTSTTALVQKLQQARLEFRLPEMLARLGKIPLLILDDIGYVKKDQHETSVLFDLIADRYESSSIIITANQPFSEWDNIFPDSMMAVAAIDRLVHHATIISVNGESFRRTHSSVDASVIPPAGVPISVSDNVTQPLTDDT